MRSTHILAGPVGHAAVTLAILALTPTLLAPPPGGGNGNGNGGHGGNGGGGGDPPPPAEPAISFVGGSNRMLGVMNADGTNVTALGIEGAGGPTWSPDLDGDPDNGYQGSLVYDRDLGNGDYVLEVADIRVIAGVPTALGVRQVASSFAVDPSWSPDLDLATPGYQGAIAFTDFENVYTVDIEWDGNGFDPSTVHASTIDTLLSDALVFYPTFGPDGTQLVCSRTDFSTYEIYLIDLLTLEVSVLDQTADIAREFDWRHDAGELVYNVGQDLWSLDPDAPGSSVMLDVSGRSPSFAPDDGALVFQAKSGRAQAIQHVDLVTGELSVLLKDKAVDFLLPDWRD